MAVTPREISPATRVAAHRHDQSCHLCEHRCGVNRLTGPRGICRAGTTARVFAHRVEYGDELELVPSHCFYLSGCDLRCVFCLAEQDAFDPSRGTPLTAEFFNEAVAWGRGQGAKNVQWIGGEPTIHLPAILDVMSQCPDLPPIVWKSDLHATVEAMELLHGVVNTHVADFKFGNDQCAKRLARVENYVAVVIRNLKIAASHARLIVRHLVLPGHFDCCLRPILNWLAGELPTVPVSLRDGYMPAWRAGHFVELTKPIDRQQMDRARELARLLGVEVIQ